MALAQLRCNDCHGITGSIDYRPVDAPNRDIKSGGFVGSHRSHLAEGAREASCAICHPGSSTYSANHRNGFITLQSKLNNSPVRTPYGNNSSNFPQNANPIRQQCSGVNCHFESDTPTWGGSLTGECTDCHGAPPSYGAHVKHSALFGADISSCRNCHKNHYIDENPRNHARQAGSRPLYIQFSAAANRSGSYSAGSETNYPNYLPSQQPTRNGSCTSLYCHSNGKGISVASPPWSSGLTLGCNGCHGTDATATTGAPNYANGGEGTVLANSHPGHMDSGRIICADCHIGTTATGTIIVAGSTLHINSQLDVTFKDGGSYDKQPKSCSGTNSGSCHGTGNPRWGGTDACATCHGGDAGSSKPIQHGMHRSHMNNYTTLGRGNNLGCAECHASTVSDNFTLISSGRHRNGTWGDYTGAKAGRIESSGSGRCANAYCHSSGTRKNQYWNMSSSRWESGTSLNCNGCHGTLTLPDGTFQTYTSVAGEPSYPNTGVGTPLANSHQKHVVGIQDDTTGCSRCHRSTGDATIAGKLRDYTTAHLDRQRNVRFAAAIQGRYSATSQQCLNLYCHSNGEPFDNSTAVYLIATWGDSTSTGCGSCHGDAASADRLSGRHGKHTASTIYVSSCDRCHANTINADGSLKDKKLHANRSKDIAFRDGGTYNTATKGCGSTTYCHSDAASTTPPWGAALTAVKWPDKTNPMQCYSCHKGRVADSTETNCESAQIQGHWTSAKCTPTLTMNSNGHERLVGMGWVRKYPCYYCHNGTVDENGNIKDSKKHLDTFRNISIASKWAIGNRPPPAYDKEAKVCNNLYCHSDGTSDPDLIRPIPWTGPRTECNSCHGHPNGSCSDCHDGTRKFVFYNVTTILSIQTGWPSGMEWKAALPMFPNQGPNTARANSHPRHVETNFTCDKCHNKTVLNGTCTDCHIAGIPPGSMDEKAHIDPFYHVDKDKTVEFKDGGYFNTETKSCSGTATGCHKSELVASGDPIWGGSVNSAITCLGCHGTTNGDVDSFSFVLNGVKTKINTTEWETSGHGRYSSAAKPGTYPKSRNPAANFPLIGNPCLYCHDNNVVHNTATNPFRLKMHNQYKQRFAKECVYCHMEKDDVECRTCHNSVKSLAPQLVNMTSARFTTNHVPYASNSQSCILSCHAADATIHKTGGSFWTPEQKDDIQNQYMMMGVCLQCHDDDSNNQCTSCHTAPANNPNKYSLGFNPGSGLVKPRKARASGGHFGYKHYRDFTKTGGWTKVKSDTRSPIFGTFTAYQGSWKGGKFCWDCHDPHGDSNIYMIQKKVATVTDGRYGIPLSEQTRATVTFTNNTTGSDYVKKTGTIEGICNVCHSADSKHYTSVRGDGHRWNQRCTTCHEHRFANSHANKQACDSCHSNKKPIPKHTAFGLPRDCTKCHSGTVGMRMDIMGQMKSNSHHVQGIEVNNKHCYACHWEATKDGLIDNQYHTGYNYKNYTSVKNDIVDLVLYGPKTRPTVYRNTSTAAGRATATTFLASNIGKGSLERTEVSKVSNHCISCHSDQNNNHDPFGDCKTPSQYAWDFLSIDARYSQTGTTTWGKYVGTTNASQKNITKSFSAHGKATLNGGGWDTSGSNNGVDGTIVNTRAGTGNTNVQCFDCHNSHGSKVEGVSSSYVTFNGTNNGANLKETKENIGGYSKNYKASSNTTGINPYGAGAGQCFDCHNSPAKDTDVSGSTPSFTPWGYTTFGATAPIMGYKDTPRFGDGVKASTARFPERMMGKQTIVGGHLKSSQPNGALPGLARESGTVTSIGTTTTLTDSTKNWWMPDNSEVFTGTALKNGRVPTTGTTYTYKPSQTTYYYPVIGTGRTITRVWVDFKPKYSNDKLTIYNQAGNLICQKTTNTSLTEFHDWVDVATATATTGLRTVYYCTYIAAGTPTGYGGDVPKVLRNTQVPENKWQNLYLLITGSTVNNGQLRKITDYNANTLTFDAFNTPVVDGDSYKIVPYKATVNGLCTPCHDPHGVSPALESNQPYAVPLLKGTWITSPYKEDAPPPVPTGGRVASIGLNGTPKSWGRYSTSNHNYNAPTPTQPITRHTIERNTFGTVGGSPGGAPKRINENDTEFAGLCLNCHKKGLLTDGTNRNGGETGFKTLDRVHESVKGWGLNTEHSFTCSKCHQPHNSGLPRLMKTNCLDYNHRGGVAANGEAWSASKQYVGAYQGSERRGYPIGSMLGTTGTPDMYMTCHNGRYSSPYSHWPAENKWNNVTPW